MLSRAQQRRPHAGALEQEMARMSQRAAELIVHADLLSQEAEGDA